MTNATFSALVVHKNDDGSCIGKIEQKSIADLPENDVLIEVEYSSLNYKDALSCEDLKRVTREYPHTPGIDAAGIVTSSNDKRFQPGDEVLVTGYDLGMNTSGGYGKYISVPGDWVVKRPAGFDAAYAMTLGTAGFTAGLSVYEILHGGVTPASGPVLVTGATGGVGSVAVAILSKIGFDVIAVSNKPEFDEVLTQLGASQIVRRSEVDGSENEAARKPMLREKYAAVVDQTGGNILGSVLKEVKYRGVVTNCGWVANDVFETNTCPFMIRGVRLIGIDSVECPMDIRQAVWDKLANDWRVDLSSLVTETGLDGVMELAQPILKGQLKGRTLVKL
ncbi:MAG: YhdH/YhfP family quinone oxidoreductase [Cellvibrionaceae bacterium]